MATWKYYLEKKTRFQTTQAQAVSHNDIYIYIYIYIYRLTLKEDQKQKLKQQTGKTTYKLKQIIKYKDISKNKLKKQVGKNHLESSFRTCASGNIRANVLKSVPGDNTAKKVVGKSNKPLNNINVWQCNDNVASKSVWSIPSHYTKFIRVFIDFFGFSGGRWLMQNMVK